MSQKNHLLLSFHLQVWRCCSYLRPYQTKRYNITLMHPFCLFSYVLCRGHILFIRPDLATTQCPSVCLLLVSTHVLINRRQHSPTLNLCIITLWPLYNFCTLQPRQARQSSGTRNLLQCFDVKAIICSKEGIPPVKQDLIFTLETTEVGHLLSHCSVQRGLP